MRFLLSVLLIAAFSFIAGVYLPGWWNFAIVAFLVALAIRQSIGRSFLAGFTALFFLHLLLTFFIDQKNEGFLSAKIAQLFGLGTASFLLMIITALISGLIAGFAAMSGSSLRGATR
jgi:hypothetical protein